MIIEVWSDVVCPWCFIGKRRLEKAIAKLPDPSVIEVRHRAFQLQPDITETIPTSQHLAEKYRVSAEQVAEMQANVCSIADGEGLCYDLKNTLSGNTLDAHRLVLWSAGKGKQQDLLEALYSAYFEQSKPVFSHEDLLVIAESVGLDRRETKTLLMTDLLEDQVKEDQAIAHQLGANGVPFFVFDMKYGVSGAQPQEVFDQTLVAALSEAN
ncbi:MAG: DsbA family oxidoreductase [Actinomycetales bacterium]|nr:DsbA family oxidoreductase [Actinomycetales bacterium]